MTDGHAENLLRVLNKLSESLNRIACDGVRIIPNGEHSIEDSLEELAVQGYEAKRDRSIANSLEQLAEEVAEINTFTRSNKNNG